MSDEELIWCHECWAWKPWKHDRTRPPVRIRIRRAIGQRLMRIVVRLTGVEFEPEYGPPTGYEWTGYMIATKRHG